jgi:hypothetical protein
MDYQYRNKGDVMGFLNALTGGAAQVQMNLQKQRYQAGESVFAWVNVTAMDNINADGVVLHLFCVEHTQGGHCQRCNMNIPDQNDTVYNNEIMISGPMQMFRGQVGQFQGSIMIPQGVPSTYMGRHATNIWYLEARVKMFGNDPDTKVEIQVFS